MKLSSMWPGRVDGEDEGDGVDEGNGDDEGEAAEDTLTLTMADQPANVGGAPWDPEAVLPSMLVTSFEMAS